MQTEFLLIRDTKMLLKFSAKVVFVAFHLIFFLIKNTLSLLKLSQFENVLSVEISEFEKLFESLRHLNSESVVVPL